MFNRHPLVVALLDLLTAWAAPSRAAAGDTERAERADHWLLHLPGMGGLMRIDQNVTQGVVAGLKQDGVEPAVEIYDWTGPARGLAALTQVDRHREQSQIVADMIIKHRRANPDGRITITAHSAGTGVIAFALERLPDDVMVDEVVMIASALSPEYDLSPALRHVRGRVYAFNSDLDTIVLGAGTRVFGTVDRIKVDAAGRVGFRAPASPVDARQYEKLEQFPYDADWMRFGNNGEHIGAMTRSFARNVIARVLLGKGPPPRATTRPAPTTLTTRPAG